jgi:hypothetical protein
MYIILALLIINQMTEAHNRKKSSSKNVIYTYDNLPVIAENTIEQWINFISNLASHKSTNKMFTGDQYAKRFMDRTVLTKGLEIFIPGPLISKNNILEYITLDDEKKNEKMLFESLAEGNLNQYVIKVTDTKDLNAKKLIQAINDSITLSSLYNPRFYNSYDGSLGVILNSKAYIVVRKDKSTVSSNASEGMVGAYWNRRFDEICDIQIFTLDVSNKETKDKIQQWIDTNVNQKNTPSL